MFRSSGMLTARLAAVVLSMRIGGLSRPSLSMWVRNIRVYGDQLFEEKTSHRPLGEKLCQEFISDVLQRISRALPPCAGTMKSRLSGRISRPLRAWTKTTQRSSGDTFGDVLLMPLPDAPAIGSATPPLSALKGM